MRSTVRSVCGYRLPVRHRAFTAWAVISLILSRLALLPALGDGCFVFRWNKNIDITEPTQKAIIVHDSGREDLLLQVKYEGTLEEFGWLIPVPGLPTVEKGSMSAFYELSQLTQRQWGAHYGGATLSAGTRSAREDNVKVIEIKTVGAYKVAVLSAQDAGSLASWLKAHDYSIPEGKAGIIEEYVRKGWYFVAARINLGEPFGFQKESGAAPKDTRPSAQARDVIRKQLSSGELHPLLISFESPKCIYPLRISAVGGKPSEVSLYVLSAEALIDKFIFDKGLEKAHQRQAEWDRTAQEREKIGRRSMQNMRSLRLAALMYSLAAPGQAKRGIARDWSLEDLEAIGRESQPDTPPDRLDQRSYARAYELLQCLQVSSERIPQCAKDLPRLKGKSWYLTKQVWTFLPDEMHDLEFQAPIPLLLGALPEPEGDEAAGALTYLGASANSPLISACQSTNARQRINASSVLSMVQDPRVVELLLSLLKDAESQVRYNAVMATAQHWDPRFVELLLSLLKDAEPQVRYNAVMATAQHWDPRFVEPLMALFRDPHVLIRRQAAQWLCLHESTNRAPTYVALLRDPDPDVQACALQVLLRIDRAAIPRAYLLQSLGNPRLETVSSALSLLQGGQSSGWTYQPPITDPRFQTPADTNRLSSAEAAPLTTNRLTVARLMGLKVLRQNADAQAVALTLPLLRDTNAIVRNRAFALLQTLSRQDIPQNEPARWEQWWAANKDTFVAPN